MPRGDGTGPMGVGPMTGRAAGYCAGNGIPGFANPGGTGFGAGMGRGCRGFRHRYYATGVPGRAMAANQRGRNADVAVEYLDNEIEALEKTLKSLREHRERVAKENEK